jgi:hypothetical protein
MTAPLYLQDATEEYNGTTWASTTSLNYSKIL